MKTNKYVFFNVNFDYKYYIIGHPPSSTEGCLDCYLDGKFSFLHKNLIKFFFKFDKSFMNNVGAFYLFTLLKLTFQRDDEISFIFLDGHYLIQSRTLSSNLCKWFENAAIYVWMLNIRSKYDIGRLLAHEKYLSKIYCFDKCYAEQNGFQYLPLRLDSIMIQKTVHNSIDDDDDDDDDDDAPDIVFIGSSKPPRDKLLNQIISHCEKNDISYYFHLLDSKNANKHNVSSGYFLAYEDVLHILSKSRAIVEILQSSGSSSTLRLFESICLNKLLITNATYASFSKAADLSHVLSLEDFFTCDKFDLYRLSKNASWNADLNIKTGDFYDYFTTSK